jgi:uncharacterized membrane protein SpoIIM required for sporulation
VNSKSIGAQVLRAVTRARFGILAMALIYFLGVVGGMVMVQSGNAFALDQRDSLVGRAQATDPSLNALHQGNRLGAALWDFAENLVLGAVPSTIAGFSIVVPCVAAAYRGWIGGIVSVNGAHVSRLSEPAEAAYYLITLVLQLIPYTLAGGAGVNLGIAWLRPAAAYRGEKWLDVPMEALRDAARIYLLVVPLFVIASMWEFFAR